MTLVFIPAFFRDCLSEPLSAAEWAEKRTLRYPYPTRRNTGAG